MIERLTSRAARNLGFERLFHYRRFKLSEGHSGHLTGLVRDGIVRYSNPANFNDPWECRPFYSLSALDSAEGRERTIAWIQRAVANQAARAGTAPPSKEALEAQAAELRAKPEFLRSLVEQNTDGIAAALRAEYRVFCLAPSPDNPLMWSHYGDHHRGICLQFGTNSVFVDAYRVNYSDSYPEIDLADEDDFAFVVASLLTKSDVWQYEQEFRSINKEGGIEGSPACHDGFVKIPTDCLQAIVMGCQIEDSERHAIEKIVGNAGRKIGLHRASLQPGKFRLKIQEL